MKNKIKLLTLLLILALNQAWSAIPYLINYQGVARNANGTPMTNQNIAIRASIVQFGIGGTVYYSEVRNLTTDAEGLFNFKINSPGATSVTGVFSSINWSNTSPYLKIEMDAGGGSNFVLMGTQQLVSVPYAQHANKADGLTPYGQMSIGAVAGDVIQFDGTNWKAATLVDGLSLPYIDGDANLISFAITNTSALGGTAVTGKTTTNHVNATGVKGEATGVNGKGVNGVATGSNAFGVLGQNTTGVGVKGTSTGIAILGESSGSSGVGVKGVSNSTNAIGVYGETTDGTGVKGYSNDSGSVAVFGSSLAGTGVKAYSFTGKALDVIGNVKISGGTVPPTAGAILTSDAAGNAHWDPNTKVAFKGQNVSQTSTSGTPNHSFSQGTYKKVEFFSEDYDLNSNFTPTGANSSTTNSSTFLAPVAGIYHFNAAVTIADNLIFDYVTFKIRLMLNRNGVVSTLAESQFYGGSIYASSANLSLDKNLLVNDRLWIEYRQTNWDGSASDLNISSIQNYFTGHLVYQQ